MGAVEHIDKPFDPDKLPAKANEILKGLKNNMLKFRKQDVIIFKYAGGNNVKKSPYS